jgi:hypothetical protein
MIDNSTRELRYIRITLVILTLVFVFTAGNRTVRVENDNGGSQQVFPEFSYTNMVDLSDGNFGVLSGDASSSGSETLKVYNYEKTKIN